MIISFETKSSLQSSMPTATKSRTSRATADSAPPLVLEDFLPYRLAVLTHAVSRALGEVYGARFGLSIPEWRIVANLGRFGPQQPGDLAERSSMDKPKVTRALQRLLAAGLITRAIDSADRRQARIALTRKGASVFREIGSLARAWETDLLAPLSDSDRKSFDRILSKLTERTADLRTKPSRRGVRRSATVAPAI
jgi:DNA-binding MarR family transcriptional regulator